MVSLRQPLPPAPRLPAERIRKEYEARDLGEEIEESIIVSEPPPFGMTLNHPDFLADIRAALASFRPDD